MVNILIHQFRPRGAVVDRAALEQFEKQWATYQKVVDADWLSHKAVGKLLHETLNQTFAGPFSFLDIGSLTEENYGRARGSKRRKPRTVSFDAASRLFAVKKAPGQHFLRKT